MSERRLIGLMSNLPPEAALMQALYGADAGSRWSQTDYLLASVLDTLRVLAWVTGMTATEDKRFKENPLGNEPPEPVYRPVARPEPEVAETPLSDMGTWLAQIGTMPSGS